MTTQERLRLADQTYAVYRRLKMGPASNRELSALALKYTSRISDLRAKGIDVVVKEHDHDTGKVVYALN